jgi:hypothetical protein
VLADLPSQDREKRIAVHGIEKDILLGWSCAKASYTATLN